MVSIQTHLVSVNSGTESGEVDSVLAHAVINKPNNAKDKSHRFLIKRERNSREICSNQFYLLEESVKINFG